MTGEFESRSSSVNYEILWLRILAELLLIYEDREEEEYWELRDLLEDS